MPRTISRILNQSTLLEVCRKCKTPVIPGLDASYCPNHGWIENRSVEELAKLNEAKQRKTRKPKDKAA